MKYQFSENNSGGRWWLSRAQYEALKAAGWVPPAEDKNGRDDSFLSTKDVPYSWRSGWTAEFATIREAVESWERATGADFFEEGCNCCGAPFLISGDGEYLSGDSAELLQEARADLARVTGPGSPAARWEWLMDELQRLVPDSWGDMLRSDEPPEIRYVQRVNDLRQRAERAEAQVAELERDLYVALEFVDAETLAHREDAARFVWWFSTDASAAVPTPVRDDDDEPTLDDWRRAIDRARLAVERSANPQKEG